jgi:fructose-bisphosphate aldolase, class I
MSIQIELQSTIVDLVVKGKGILAADESHPTMAKRFTAINVDSTEESRRVYRSFITADYTGVRRIYQWCYFV